MAGAESLAPYTLCGCSGHPAGHMLCLYGYAYESTRWAPSSFPARTQHRINQKAISSVAKITNQMASRKCQ